MTSHKVKAPGWGQDIQGGEETDLIQDIMYSLFYELGKGGMHGLQECKENTGSELCVPFTSLSMVLVTRRDQREAY